MRVNSSIGLVEVSKKAIENNLHIRQQLLWASKSFLMLPTYQELKITLHIMQFKLIHALTDNIADIPTYALTDAATDAHRDVSKDTQRDAPTDTPRDALRDAQQVP